MEKKHCNDSKLLKCNTNDKHSLVLSSMAIGNITLRFKKKEKRKR